MSEQQLVANTKAMNQPIVTFTRNLIPNDLKPTLLAFKTALHFSPLKVHEIKLVAADLEIRAFRS